MKKMLLSTTMLFVFLALGCGGNTDPSDDKDPNKGGKGDCVGDNCETPLLVCTQKVDAPAVAGKFEVFDLGLTKAEEIPADLPWTLESEIIDKGIPVKKYNLKGNYSIDGKLTDLDKVYFGNIFDPGGDAYSKGDAYNFSFLGDEVYEENSRLVVRVGCCTDFSLLFVCTGDIPSADDVIPTFPNTDFVCTTETPEDGQTATIKFTVTNLLQTTGTFALIWPEDEESSPISVEPDTSAAYTMVGGIVDGSISYQDGKLIIFTDEIGCNVSNLVLYENNNYEHGYFEVDFRCSGDEVEGFYTKVACQLTPPFAEQKN